MPDADEFGILTLAAITTGVFDPNEAKAIGSDAVEPDWPRLRSNTILITRASGSKALVGACALISEDHDKRIIPDTAWELEMRKGTDIPLRWVLEYLKSQLGRRAIERIARGTSGIWKITKESLARIPMPVGSPHQMTGTHRLSEAFDKAIGLLEELINTKREFKRGLMQELLTGRRRFPEFTSSKWVKMPLGQFFIEKNVRNTDGKTDFVYSCSKLYGVIPQMERFKNRVASRDVSNYKVVEPGDLVYDPMLLWDSSIGFVSTSQAGVVSPAYITFEFREDRGYRPFFAYALKTHRAEYLYRAISQGTNVRRRKANSRDFLKIEILVPTEIEEQIRIGDFFVNVDKEIDLLLELKERLETQKRGLLQKLLTGELTIPVPETTDQEPVHA